jgi:cytochrome c oxidase subunit I
MPRRIYTYEAGRGWEGWNIIVGIGAIFQALGTSGFVYNLIQSYFKGKEAGH